MPSPVELNELRNMSGGVRKRILELLHGIHIPKTQTAAQVGTIQSVVADDVGQLMRVGPFAIVPPRVDAYDWWIAETTTSWRQLDTANAATLNGAYATIASVALKAPTHSPTFTGIPLAPAVEVGTDTNQIATAAMVTASVAPALSGLAGKAPLVSPAFQGAPTAETPLLSDNTRRLATTAFVQSLISAAGAPSRHTASETPPLNPAPNDSWFDTTTGSSFIFYDGFWVECIGRAEYPNTTMRASATSVVTAINEDINGYVRLTASGAKIFNVPSVDANFNAPVGCIITVRNASNTTGGGNITLTPLASLALPLPTLNAAVGELVIPPQTTAQIIYAGNNVWDVL